MLGDQFQLNAEKAAAERRGQRLLIRDGDLVSVREHKGHGLFVTECKLASRQVAPREHAAARDSLFDRADRCRVDRLFAFIHLPGREALGFSVRARSVRVQGQGRAGKAAVLSCLAEADLFDRVGRRQRPLSCPALRNSGP